MSIVLKEFLLQAMLKHPFWDSIFFKSTPIVHNRELHYYL